MELLFARDSRVAIESADHQGSAMKIITWNINGIRAVTQKGFYQFWEKEDPDFLCVQETKCHPDQLDDALASPLGWKSFWSAAQRPGYSGVATFCKTTPESID